MAEEEARSAGRRRFARLAAVMPLVSVISGSAAQAGNTVLVADLGTAMGAVDPWQGLAFRLMWVFWPLAFIGTVAVPLLGRQLGLRLRPGRGALGAHIARFGVGYLATAALFQGAGLLKKMGKALGTATLFSNSGGFVTALLSLFDRRKPISERWADMVPASVGILGVYAAVAYGLPAGEFMNFPVALLAVGCALLGVLALVQKGLMNRELGERPASDRSPLEKLLLALKISTVFGIFGGITSTVVYVATSLRHGWLALDGSVVRTGIALAMCYALSQVLIQAGHGFGNPAITGPLMFAAVPFGYLLDEWRGLEGFTPQHIAGTGFIVVSAAMSFWLTARRNRTSQV